MKRKQRDIGTPKGLTGLITLIIQRLIVVDFTELKKGFLDWKPLWYMVGRERLERSTSGLKVRQLTPLNSTSRVETLYPSLYNNKPRHSCNTSIIPKSTFISRQVHEICTKLKTPGEAQIYL